MENCPNFSLDCSNNVRYSFSEYHLPWPGVSGSSGDLRPQSFDFFFPLIHIETTLCCLMCSRSGPQPEWPGQLPIGKWISVQVHSTLSSNLHCKNHQDNSWEDCCWHSSKFPWTGCFPPLVYLSAWPRSDREQRPIFLLLMMGAMGESYKKWCILLTHSLLKALKFLSGGLTKQWLFSLKIWPVARHIITNFITGSKPSQGRMDSISRNTSVSHVKYIFPHDLQQLFQSRIFLCYFRVSFQHDNPK